ncbi:hypothetical protein CDL12_24504 [Handroanthus impetiginosus]|uniref:Uncharacterized protein n=1 Tax=Handroanthus impetiginosus TaxID=429701 RepID=A0A2G9GDA3_9LAMI|nr:hypothetical protein CDL12_24504 [Handroanthus impetiginosus]
MNQQKKIEELEAQLQEAEDIVRDLREELGEVQDELERVKKYNLQHVNEPNNARSREMETITYSYPSNNFLHLNSQDEFAVSSHVKLPNPRQINKSCECNSKIVCICSSYVGTRDLPSIILRGKEPGPYRNGCTQRILACERHLLDRELCLSGKTDKEKEKNNSREQEEGSGAKTVSGLEKKMLPNIQKRKRAPRQRKTVMPLSVKQADLFQRHVRVLDKDSAYSSENSAKIAPILSSDKAEESSMKQTNLVETFGGRIIEEDGVKEIMVQLREGTGFAESLSSPDYKVDAENIDMMSNGLESNPFDTIKKLPSQSVRGGAIKYTFQRKRKREALSGPENDASPETKTKTGGEQNCEQNLERPRSRLSMELSRDSRRMAQVARQLISLSERKWWD